MEKFLVIYIRWKTRHILFSNGQNAAAVEKCAWKMLGDFRLVIWVELRSFVHRVLCSFIQKMLKLGNVWNHFDRTRKLRTLLSCVFYVALLQNVWKSLKIQSSTLDKDFKFFDPIWRKILNFLIDKKKRISNFCQVKI